MKDVALFAFGLGYSAQALARLVLQAAGRVIGTSRAPAATEADGCRLLRFAAPQPLAAPAAALQDTTHLLSSIPPDADGDPALRAHRGDIAGLRQLRWIGYFSTTGVYGDHGGGWVDETTPPAPAQARSRQRLMAEQEWLEFGRSLGVPTHVFRLPGIYGRGRSALDQVRAGTARRIERAGQFFSRIHVDDIAATALASMQQPRQGAIYNVADDEPAAPADVIAFACELLGRTAPPVVAYDVAAPGMSPMARSFWSENRRVKNDRIKRELGVSLRFPGYREGLRAILDSGG